MSAVLVEPISQSPPGPGFLIAAGCTILLLLLQVGMGVAGAIICLILGVDQGRLPTVLLPAGTATVLLSSVLLAVLVFGSRTASILGLRRFRLGQALLVVLLTCPLAVAAGEIAAYASDVFPSFVTSTFQEFSEQPFLFVFVAACLMPAVGEEIFFRGVLGRGLIARYGVWGGCLLTALLFALMHVDPVQATSAFALGMALHGVFVATKSLFASMLLHALNNTLGFVMIRHPDIPGVRGHFPPLIVAGAVIALVAIGILFYQMRSRWICLDGSEWSPGYATTETPPGNISAEPRVERPSIRWVAVAALAYTFFLGAAAWAVPVLS